MYWQESGDTIRITIQGQRYDILRYIVIRKEQRYIEFLLNGAPVSSSYYKIPHSPQHSEGACLCKHMPTGGARNSNTPRTFGRRGGARGGGARYSNTPRTYDQHARGGMRATVSHHGPMTCAGGGGCAQH